MLQFHDRLNTVNQVLLSFFLRRFASAWHSSEQYFCIPLLGTNVLPQNSHFLVGLILFDIAMFYYFEYSTDGVNGSEPLTTFVNPVRDITLFAYQLQICPPL